MKNRIIITAIILFCFTIVQCTFFTESKVSKTPSKTKKVMYLYIAKDNAKKYSLTNEKGSEYFIFNNDDTFIFENHKDTYFSFVYGTYSVNQDEEISILIDTAKSKSLINTYRDSTIWNYRFSPEILAEKSFIIKQDSLVILSKDETITEKVLLINK